MLERSNASLLSTRDRFLRCVLVIEAAPSLRQTRAHVFRLVEQRCTLKLPTGRSKRTTQGAAKKRPRKRGHGNMSWDPVYRFVKQIPRGRVLSYGALAKILRLPGGARSAGRAMAATPSGKGIPWHRVLGEGGKILVREPYGSLQKKLLETEGVAVIESRVNLKQHLWKPAA